MTGELLAIGANHKTAPLPLREKLALPDGRAGRVMVELVEHEAIHEAVAISTCNRTELYLVVADPVEAESVALGILSRQAGLRPTELLGAIYALRGSAAVEHLFSVTAGLDSMIVGEAEVQGQVKRSYEMALVEGVTGPVTNRLFRDALATGKRVRNETEVSRSSVSVSSVAVKLAADFLGDLADRRVLVIGAGENAELTARALRDRGVEALFVANRRYDRALGLAQRYGGRADRIRRAAGRARARGHRGELDWRAASDRGARGARVRGGVADGTAARHDRPGGAARHRARRARLPGHRAVRHGRPPGGGRAQPERPPGRGRRGARDRARGGGALRRAGSSRSTWCRLSPRCARRGDEIVEQVLRENEPRWESLSEADRERVEHAGGRGGEPAAARAHAHPARAPPARAPRTATCTRCTSCSGWRRAAPSSRSAAAEVTRLDAAPPAPPAGDPARHARQRAGAGAGALGRRAAARRGGARADHDLGRRAAAAARAELTDKSRFVKEIEEALLRGAIDLAVHSAKDVPAESPDGPPDRGVPGRADPRDALCGAESLDELAGGRGRRHGACAAAHCCSRLRPDLDVRDLRGNVDTRLRRLRTATSTPIVLAQAGLDRLGRGDEGTPLDPDASCRPRARAASPSRRDADDAARGRARCRR